MNILLRLKTAGVVAAKLPKYLEVRTVTTPRCFRRQPTRGSAYAPGIYQPLPCNKNTKTPPWCGPRPQVHTSRPTRAHGLNQRFYLDLEPVNPPLSRKCGMVTPNQALQAQRRLSHLAGLIDGSGESETQTVRLCPGAGVGSARACMCVVAGSWESSRRNCRGTTNPSQNR